MRQAQNCQNDIDVHPLRKKMKQMFIFMGFLLFSLVSSSSLAFENNPGSNLMCPAGSTKGFLSNESYSDLVTSFTSKTYQTVSSQSTFSDESTVNIPLKIKMSVLSSGESATSSTPKLYGSTPQAISFIGSPSSSTPSTAITLDFQDSADNPDNNKPIFLTSVAVSAFDIDKSVNNGSWDDNIKITGVTSSGGTAVGKLQNITDSRIIIDSSGLRLPNSPNNDNCSNSLESKCQGSVVFDEAIKSVTLVYTDLKNNRTPSSRRFEFRLDSYCYKPTPAYSITKDDGITSIGTSSNTNYIIQITNTGDTSLSNIKLKDPAVNGLTKLTDITCDATDTTNFCSSSTTPPTKAELESTAGFTIPSLPVGRSYTIKIPTRVTASQGSTVTNTATIKTSNLDLKSASDSNTVTSIFSGGSPVAPASCPSGHKMYYIGSNPPDYSPKETLSIGWQPGDLSKEYVFGNTKFELLFSDQLNLRTGYPTGTNFTDATANAINMYHDSFRTTIDHKLTATIDKPVSKYGFVVQDLDSNQAGKYIESITLATSGGFFSKTENKPFQLSNANQTISGTAWDNCNTASPCDFNIDWGYKPASTPFAITHGNPYSGGATTTSAGGYVTGYSDFYFCLAPPKLVVKKVLSGNRVNDSADNADQFEIKVTGDSLAANSFTTAGNAATINNGTSDLLSLAESKTYTISERVINGSISNYSATYVCNNATTGSTFTTTNGTATLNAETIPTRSFTLSNLNYGDEITCTITNTPSVYTFSGTVFDDNGGITAAQASATNANITTGPYANNSSYFNGKYDSPTESGIPFTADHTVTLNKCTSDSGTFSAQTVNIGNDGTYSFSLTPAQVGSYTRLCVTQNEPSDYEYAVDTTSNVQQINITNNKYNYPNNDFGDVIQANAALVLIKSQYVHDCSLNNLATIGVNYDGSASSAYSIKPISDIIPGQCIAYRIEAINRSNVSLADIVIKDKLQNKNDSNNSLVTSTLFNPTPISENSGAPSFATNSVSIGNNGTVITNTFSLGATNSTRRQAIRFNTKYGTTVNAQ